MTEQVTTIESLPFDLWICSVWKVGSIVEIYSATANDFIKGRIIRIFSDDEGEWTEVQYKYQNEQRVKQIDRNGNLIRPWTKSKSICKYIYDAIKTTPSCIDDHSGDDLQQSNTNIQVIPQTNTDDISTTLSCTNVEDTESRFIFSSTNCHIIDEDIDSNNDIQSTQHMCIDIKNDSESADIPCIFHRSNSLERHRDPITELHQIDDEKKTEITDAIDIDTYCEKRFRNKEQRNKPRCAFSPISVLSPTSPLSAIAETIECNSNVHSWMLSQRMPFKYRASLSNGSYGTVLYFDPFVTEYNQSDANIAIIEQLQQSIPDTISCFYTTVIAKHNGLYA